MDDVITKDEDITSRELSATNRLEAVWSSAEERVVLLAAVQSDNCPHTMVVGVEGHTWGPGNMQHRQVWRIVQSRDPAALDGSERILELGTISD
jgi:hypothetical protein